MPTLFEKNVTLAANKADIVTTTQTFRLEGVNFCQKGSRCELCHQPITRTAKIKFETGESRHIGLDCHERLEFIRREGREPVTGELESERRARRAWRNNIRRKPVIASAVAFLQQRREALPENERRAFEFLEVAGHPRTVEEGEALLAYHRQADPLWLLRLVRQKHPDWRKRLGTVVTVMVLGVENFRQVQTRNRRYAFLGHYSGRKYVHEWTYDAKEGKINLKRYSREWYEEHGNYRGWLKKSTPKKPSSIKVTFEEGTPNLIAKRPSDLGPYVVLDFRVPQAIKIEVGKSYQVEITRLSQSGTTRFCRVLASAE